MVKLLVKEAFRRKEGFVLCEEGDIIEVSEEIAKQIEELVPERVERVKPTPKKQTRKPKSNKNEDDE